MPILEIKNLTKSYERGSRSFNAVDSVNLSVEKASYVNIIGRSGSGKSTLLNIVSGMISPSGGDVMIDGESIVNKTDSEMSRFRNEKIGYIPQGSSTMPNLTVLDNVVLPFYLYKREGDAYGRARKILDLLNIRELEYAYPKELSGGEHRRVLIARSLINEPEILIADEATSNLDVVSGKEVMELFSRINEEGVTILLVSHELDLLSYGARVYTMEDGVLSEGNSLSV